MEEYEENIFLYHYRCNKGIKALTILLVMAAFIVFPASAEGASVTREVSETYIAAGAEIEVTLSISGMKAGGIVETIPQGWSVVSSDHPADRTRISGQSIIFSVIDETEIIYLVRAGSNGGSIAGQWDDALNCTGGVIPATSISVSGGEGGDTDSTTPATGATTAGTTSLLFSVDTTSGHSFARNDGVVTGIRIWGEGDLEGVNLSIERTAQPPDLPSPDGIPYSFLAITASGLDDGNITRAEITFEVNTSWMDTHRIDPSSVVLMRYNNTWTALHSEQSGTAGNATRFTAISPGFSAFAITGTEIGTEATVTTTSSLRTTETKKPITVATPVHQSRPDLNAGALKDETISGFLIPGLVIAAAICGGAGYLLYTRRKKSEDEVKE